jgi:hypothetical protein
VRTTWLEWGLSLVVDAFGVFILVRYGLVATVMCFAMGLMLEGFPWTTDLSTWFAPQTILGWTIVLAILVYGFLTAVGGRSLFRDPLSDTAGMASQPKGGAVQPSG